MLGPNQIAGNGTEHGHQAAFFAYCNLACNFGFDFADKWASGSKEKPPLDERFVGKRFPALQWIHAIPNGGSRGSDEKSRAIAGARLKAEGVKPGIADIFLPHAVYFYRDNCNFVYHGLYIELKKLELKPVRPGSKGGKSDEQIEFESYCMKSGYAHVTAYGWQEAVNALKSYLSLK